MFFFIIGAIIGSFTNVLIYRLPRNISILNPSRSICPSCNRKIPWYDNIPILSYLILKGRCRFCGWKIPLRYLIVEILMCSLFTLNSIILGFPENILACIITFSVVLLTFIDIEYMMIPDTSFFSLLVVGIAEILISGQIIPNIMTAIVAFFVFLLVRYISKKGLGFGDVKLFSVSGLILGPLNFIFSVFIASVSGILVILPYLIKGKLGMRSKIPFGPFIGWSVYTVYLMKDLIGDIFNLIWR